MVGTKGQWSRGYGRNNGNRCPLKGLFCKFRVKMKKLIEAEEEGKWVTEGKTANIIEEK
jgi:hypothetical protein